MNEYFPGIEIFKFPNVNTISNTIEHKFVITSNIEEYYHNVSDRKFEKLKELMVKSEEKVLIFCDSTTACQNIVRYLKGANVSIIEYSHSKGNVNRIAMEGESRISALSAFEEGKKKVLVTTNESGVRHNNLHKIINFYFPSTGASYLKRAQTLAGNSGQSISTHYS